MRQYETRTIAGKNTIRLAVVVQGFYSLSTCLSYWVSRHYHWRALSCVLCAVLCHRCVSLCRLRFLRAMVAAFRVFLKVLSSVLHMWVVKRW